MNDSDDIKKLIYLCKPIDYRFKYILTIKLNLRFNETTSIKNQDLMNYFSKTFLFSNISKIIKLKLKNKKYSKLKYNQLERTKKHLLSITSFERSEDDDLIHFHYIFSNFIQSKSNQYHDLIYKLEQDIFKSFKKIIEKKSNGFYEVWLEHYIPYNVYIMVHPETKLGYISYILKQSNNHNIPAEFYSVALCNLLNKQKGIK